MHKEMREIPVPDIEDRVHDPGAPEIRYFVNAVDGNSIFCSSDEGADWEYLADELTWDRHEKCWIALSGGEE